MNTTAVVLGGTGKTGRLLRLADGVQCAVGCEPRDFGDYARRTAAAGIWDGAR